MNLRRRQPPVERSSSGVTNERLPGCLSPGNCPLEPPTDSWATSGGPIMNPLTSPLTPETVHALPHPPCRHNRPVRFPDPSTFPTLPFTKAIGGRRRFPLAKDLQDHPTASAITSDDSYAKTDCRPAIFTDGNELPESPPPGRRPNAGSMSSRPRNRARAQKSAPKTRRRVPPIGGPHPSLACAQNDAANSVIEANGFGRGGAPESQRIDAPVRDRTSPAYGARDPAFGGSFPLSLGDGPLPDYGAVSRRLA
jgi:hypothetical protein